MSPMSAGSCRDPMSLCIVFGLTNPNDWWYFRCLNHSETSLLVGETTFFSWWNDVKPPFLTVKSPLFLRFHQGSPRPCSGTCAATATRAACGASCGRVGARIMKHMRPGRVQKCCHEMIMIYWCLAGNEGMIHNHQWESSHSPHSLLSTTKMMGLEYI